MASSANLRHDSAKLLSIRSSYTASSRRTASFSSSFSSSSSSSLDSSSFLDGSISPLAAPATPLPFSGAGVPFSWEHFPGIPKKQTSKKLLLKDSTTFLLPLPPPTTSKQVSDQIKPICREKNSADKKKHVCKQSIMERDPFFDALVECSKDDHGRRGSHSHRWNHLEASKVSTRSLGDRICSVGLYASCKRTCACATDESIVHRSRISRSRSRSSTGYSYDLIHGRSR